MAIRTEQSDAVDKLLYEARELIFEARDRNLCFDPWKVEGLRGFWEPVSSPIEPLYLRGTRHRQGIQEIGSVTVALFDQSGPSLSRDHDDVKHHGVPVGILLEPASEIALRRFEAEGVDTSRVWIGRVLVPNNAPGWDKGVPATMSPTIIAGIIPIPAPGQLAAA